TLAVDTAKIIYPTSFIKIDGSIVNLVKRYNKTKI
ncbi:MAG: hypothetical protein ACI85I_001978, partial [Arenicella sp.]